MDATPRPDDDAGRDADLVDADEAAAILGVERSRIDVLVADELLTVADDRGGAARFRRAEVQAVRLAGG